MTGRRPGQFALDLPHRPSLAREDLIVTAANRTAVAAIDAWPNWPHPVLLIVGPEGSGKSHLAAAWSEGAGAVPFGTGLPERRPFAVAIDGLETFGFRERELFEVVNAARLGGGSVLATASAAPDELPFALADLRSRLRAATLARIAPPDDDLLKGVLAKLFADRQLDLDPRLVDHMASRMERSLGAARRIVERIDREALARKEKVTRGLINAVLEDETRRRHADVSDEA